MPDTPTHDSTVGPASSTDAIPTLSATPDDAPVDRIEHASSDALDPSRLPLGAASAPEVDA